MTDLPSAQDDNQIPSKTVTPNTVPVTTPPAAGTHITTSGVGGKEKEILPHTDSHISELGVTSELAGELKEIGVEKISETVNLPQPISDSTGLTHAGPTTPVTVSQPLPVKVPLTDDQIKTALHKKVADSILWLAYWCLRQIKIAHSKVLAKDNV